MRLLGRLAQYWPALLTCILALLALLLLWLVRATPLQPTPALRIDALSAFFIFVLLAGTALAALIQPVGFAPGWRGLALLVLLLLAWATTLTPIVAVAYLLAALLATTDDRRRTTDDGQDIKQLSSRFVKVARRRSAPTLLAAGALLVGYGALALRGALFYDARTAGAALDGFAFWFVLLAAALPAIDDRRPTTDDRPLAEDRRSRIEDRQPAILDPRSSILDLQPVHRVTLSSCHLVTLSRLAWLYPLVRLYSLGPWNSGWSLAALLLGGGAALWAALAAFTHPAERHRLTQMSVLAMALAGFALSSGAGIVAGCYALLAYLVLALPPVDDRRPTTDDRRGSTNNRQATRDKSQETRDVGQQRADQQEISGTGLLTTDHGQLTEDRGSRIEDRQPAILDPRSSILDPQTRSPAHPLTRSPAHWLLSGAIPFTAPFVAAWMLVGASVAGGVALLAGVAWLAMLLSSLAIVLAGGSQAHSDRRPSPIAAGASVLLGVGAPLVVLALIQPVVEQLQGGLTPYGDVNIWPWIGLASIDAARAQVTTLPSIAVAALMLVLSALVYLIARLRDSWQPTDDDTPPAPPPPDLLDQLRAEVPWLAALGPRSPGKERRVDGE